MMTSIQKGQMMGALVVLALAMLSDALCQDRQEAGLVTLVGGKVDYSRVGVNAFEPLLKGMRVPEGASVRTGGDGRAVILTVSGAASRVGPNSLVVFDRMKTARWIGKNKVRLNLRSGSMTALINKDRRGRTDFRIKTPQGIAAARGTLYAVTVAGNQTFAQVKEGAVLIEATKPRPWWRRKTGRP